MLIIYLYIFLISCSVKYSIAHFGYSKRQQHLWAQTFKMCAGKMQSPVAISSKKSLILPLPALEMIKFHNLMGGTLVLHNNGHSVSLNFEKQNSDEQLPYVFGAMLTENQNYVLQGLHFHWGNKNNRGSEHTLNGVSYPMEMHMIFKNTAYPETAEALSNEDGLTVLATFFQEDDNESLSPIVESLPVVKWKNSRANLNVTFTLNSLLPKDTDTFYTYRGSLTTPPCSEAVTWIIFSMTVPISFKQMNKFRILSNGEDVLAENYRKLQKIGNRKVYLRKLTPKFTDNPELNFNLNVSSLNWYWQ
ncbi:carbonic anhydrase 2-like [Fopius arisanus]|uniref:Carbonic anhydrase n=1 Tax=Fopius arisanus TaxID=64838 RepID=A0A9R1TPS8_9HYME|nr:PREDICTED: carbonic anhydrase 2-like [Fopius arisanus]